MPLYAYKGVGVDGKSVSGHRDADSPKGLRQLLRKDGIMMTSSIVAKGGAKAGEGSKGLNREVNLGELMARVKKKEVAVFTRQLATLLQAGIPLAESLGALFDQTENLKFKSVIGEVRAAVNEGTSLADALQKHPKVFEELFVSMIRAGELAGNLDDVLVRLADFLESTQELKSKVTGAMIYPIIMVIVSVVVLAVLMIFVVPKITAIYDQQEGATLPINTRFLIWVSDMTSDYLVVWIALWTGIIIGFRSWVRSPTGRPAWHRLVLRLPLFGALVRKVAVARFSRTLGTMLQSGVPMLRSLDTARQVMGNVILMDAIERAKGAVSEGESLAVVLRKSGHFPATMVHMVAVGERAGKLEDMLERVAEAYESEVETQLEYFTRTLEPLMIVIMGAIVAFVVFSVLMPMMDMAKFTKV